MILSQKKIFYTFPGSVEESAVLKIISANCSRQNISYIPNKELWLNRIFFNLSNKEDKTCLKIDCHQNILNDPAKFRSNADNEKE